MKLRNVVCIALLTFFAAVLLAGCRKHVNVAVYTYEENDDGEIVITGLTDKGRTDTTLDVPSELDGKKVIGITGNAFANDTVVTSVTIGDGISYISENVFLGCYNLTDIQIPESVQSVGTNAFTGTPWEDNTIAAEGQLVINGILVKVSVEDGTYTIPDDVRVIASGVFYNMTELTGVNIPEGVEEIGTYAFSGCTGLESIELPESLRRIEYGAFANCGLEYIRVPDYVVYIGNEAFFGVQEISYNGSATGSTWGAESVQDY